jgi:hypothetical protein
VGERRELHSFNFGANPRGENCSGAVKDQNRATITKYNNASERRGTGGRDNADHDTGEHKLQDYS